MRRGDRGEGIGMKGLEILNIDTSTSTASGIV